MKIIIAGTGAMGATYGSLLKEAGNEVVFLDSWKENVDKINTQGIEFHDQNEVKHIEAKASFPQECKEEADLVIVFTKSMQLPNMLENIKHLFAKNTYVLCMLNGLGHIDTLKQYVNEDRIIMGVTVLTASMKGPGVFACSAHGKTEIQNIAEGGKEGALKVVEALNNASLPTEYHENIRYAIWRKACINGTMNCLCALLDCNMLQLGQIPKSRDLLQKIVQEFHDVAQKEGVEFSVKEFTDMVCWFTTEEFKGVMHYPSMHQDLIQNKRYTEIDFLNAYVAKKAKEYGIEAPYCELLGILVHGRESVLNVK